MLTQLSPGVRPRKSCDVHMKQYGVVIEMVSIFHHEPDHLLQVKAKTARYVCIIPLNGHH